MDKLISQQAAIEAFYQYPNINWTTLDVMEKIKELPTAEQDTTTHDSILAENGRNDGDRTSGDCISRAQAIDVLHGYFDGMLETDTVCPADIYGLFECMPSAQPDIIYCKDCEYLCNEDGLRGMCWHINGFGTDVKDKYNSFCSWAERREDG